MYFPVLFMFSFVFMYLSFDLLMLRSRYYIFLIIFIFIFGFVCIGLRSESSGVDTKTYIDIIASSKNEINLTLEPLSGLFFHVLSNVSDNFRVWLSLIYVFMFFCFYIACYFCFGNKYAVYCLITSMCFFTVFDLFTNGIRQGIAVFFCFVGFSLLFRRKVLAIALIAGSILFHLSTLIYIFSIVIFFLIKTVSLRKISLFFSLFILILLFFLLFGFRASSIVLSLITPLLELLLPDVLSRKLAFSLSAYESLNTGSFSNLNTSGQISLLISLYTPIIFPFIFVQLKDSDKFKLWYVVYAITIIVYAILAYEANSFRYYFLSFPIVGILITYCIISCELQSRRANYVGVFVLFINFVLSINYFWLYFFDFIEYSLLI